MCRRTGRVRHYGVPARRRRRSVVRLRNDLVSRNRLESPTRRAMLHLHRGTPPPRYNSPIGKLYRRQYPDTHDTMRNPGCCSGMTIVGTGAGFDMLEVARDLGASGIGKGLAEAVALRQGRAGPATKANHDNLESRMQSTLYRALWIQTGVIVGTVVAKLAMDIALGFAGRSRRRRRRLERFSRAVMRTAGAGGPCGAPMARLCSMTVKALHWGGGRWRG